MPLYILATIAELEGRAEEARNYHRREREIFAAFDGNRYRIERQFGELIAYIAKGDDQMHSMLEEGLPALEKKGWNITVAVQRIWAGERDGHVLIEDLNGQSALLVMMILEKLESSNK